MTRPESGDPKTYWTTFPDRSICHRQLCNTTRMTTSLCCKKRPQWKPGSEHSGCLQKAVYKVKVSTCPAPMVTQGMLVFSSVAISLTTNSNCKHKQWTWHNNKEQNENSNNYHEFPGQNDHIILTPHTSKCQNTRHIHKMRTEMLKITDVLWFIQNINQNNIFVRPELFNLSSEW